MLSTAVTQAPCPRSGPDGQKPRWAGLPLTVLHVFRPPILNCVGRSPVFYTLFALFAATATAADEPKISPAQPEPEGWLVHRVESSLQAAPTAIHVLLPTRKDPSAKYPVLYILPVEAGEENRWGDARQEAKRLNLADKYGWICVYPTFAHLPWYADHPRRADIRQETYFLDVVMPFIERSYPARGERDGRLLVGFSKSGWGAFSLLLRHPDLFAKAAAWDAPLAMEQPNRYGMDQIFGTQENFEPYQITRLLRQRADQLRDAPRLIHLGYGNFRDQHLAVESLMKDLRLAHTFRDGPHRQHAWGSGWLEEAAELLTPAP